MDNFICKKCGAESRYFTREVKPNTVGLYCEHCGTWQKWLNPEEKNKLKVEQDNEYTRILTDVILYAEAHYAYFDSFNIDDLASIISQIAYDKKITIPYLAEWQRKRGTK